MGARVLIIEDNLANLELMTYLLSAFGHTVLTAGNGLDGVETASRELPDLIVCDIQLPDIDGFEIARRLQSDSRIASIPLVAVTALAMVGDRDRVLDAGFHGYLAKPIEPETFVQQMQGFLPSHQHREAPAVPAAGSSARSAIVPQCYTVLAVDNLPVNLDLSRSLLGLSGYRVITAGGAAEGLDLARNHGCDLILSDVCMHPGSGYDFLSAVRADPQLRDLPFILLTSTYMDDRDRDRGLALGATRYLRRPIEPEALLAEIAACLEERVTR